MGSDKIHLHAVRDGDVFRIVDQSGREVSGVVSLGIDAADDDVVRLTIVVLDKTVDGEPHTNRG